MNEVTKRYTLGFGECGGLFGPLARQLLLAFALALLCEQLLLALELELLLLLLLAQLDERVDARVELVGDELLVARLGAHHQQLAVGLVELLDLVEVLLEHGDAMLDLLHVVGRVVELLDDLGLVQAGDRALRWRLELLMILLVRHGAHF